MKQKYQKQRDELFTFTQFTNRFFPGEDLQKEDNGLSRETFFNLLEKVNHSPKQSIVPAQPIQEK